jgi:hypothetical protein
MVVVYLVVLVLSIVFDVRIGSGNLQIELAAPLGAALLFLLTLGLTFIVVAGRNLRDREARWILLMGLVLVGVPTAILLGIHLGGWFGWVAVGLAFAICLILGGMQKGWSLPQSVAAFCALLVGMFLLALLFPHHPDTRPSREEIQSVKRKLGY